MSKCFLRRRIFSEVTERH